MRFYILTEHEVTDSSVSYQRISQTCHICEVFLIPCIHTCINKGFYFLWSHGFTHCPVANLRSNDLQQLAHQYQESTVFTCKLSYPYFIAQPYSLSEVQASIFIKHPGIRNLGSAFITHGLLTLFKLVNPVHVYVVSPVCSPKFTSNILAHISSHILFLLNSCPSPMWTCILYYNSYS